MASRGPRRACASSPWCCPGLGGFPLGGRPHRQGGQEGICLPGLRGRARRRLPDLAQAAGIRRAGAGARLLRADRLRCWCRNPSVTFDLRLRASRGCPRRSPAMETLRLLYMILCQLIGWLALLSRGQASKNAELLVLRTRGRGLAVRSPGHASPGQTALSCRRWPGCSPRSADTIGWWRRRRYCAGIGSCSSATGSGSRQPRRREARRLAPHRYSGGADQQAGKLDRIATNAPQCRDEPHPPGIQPFPRSIGTDTDRTVMSQNSNSNVQPGDT